MVCPGDAHPLHGDTIPGGAQGPSALHSSLQGEQAPCNAWHLHPVAMSPPRHLASSGKGMLSCAPASSPGEGDGNQPWCPLPALPSGAAHALSGPADGSQGATGCSTRQPGPPTPPPQADLLTAPTIVQLKNPYSHTCPSLPVPTMAPVPAWCWGMDGGWRS